MRTLLFLLLTGCFGCGSAYLDAGVNVYQIKNNDHSVIREAMRYLESETQHRISFVENKSTDAPDLVFKNGDGESCTIENANTQTSMYYWVQINFCQENWHDDYVNKSTVYLHEMLHAFGIGHSSDPKCVSYKHGKKTLALCPQEKQLLIDILDGKVKPDVTKDF